jgi:5-formyltetrahydrofolate cyclo-ligase
VSDRSALNPTDKHAVDHPVEKRELRRVLRLRRNALTARQQSSAARAVMRRLVRQPWFVRARTVALYVAMDGEIDPAPLLRRALAKGKRVYLPLLQRGGKLRFGAYRPRMRMRRNRFSIPEPVGGSRRQPTQLDLVLLPLVGFDRRGGRLGMGGGFYDRTFAFLKGRGQRNNRRKPRLVGLAHHFQEVRELPREAWDVPLAAVITERAWIKIASLD